MKSNPKVSIIIPVYNGSNYLKEAIDSALSQTYKNIEIIVVNDGSTDKTEKIALSYGKKIRYFRKENGGVASALNLGIKKMTGEYFSWLSHDDQYFPDKLEKQINFLAQLKNKEVVLYSNYSFINESSEPFLNPVIHNHDMLKNKPLYALYRGCINGITMLIPKSCFEICGDFDVNLRCTQDYEMWLRMIKTFDFVHMTDVLAKTRLHSKQDTNTNPRVISEGNELWHKMVTEISDEDKIKYEGTIYNFFKEMHEFLKQTPYEEVAIYCKQQCDDIRKNVEENAKKIKVSVIIPFYNREDVLFNAINSVKEQTHKNIELIVINDGSKNISKSTLNKLKDDAIINYIEFDQNMGPSYARNEGIKKAEGQYIAFLDSDDTFIPSKIEIQLNEMLLTKSLISHTSYFKRSSSNEEIANSGLFNGIVIPDIISNCPIATPTVMIERNYLIQNDYFYNTDFTIGEDVCFYLKILKGESLLGIDQPLSIVNVNSSSSAYNKEKQLLGLKNIIKYVLNDSTYFKSDYQLSLILENYVKIYNEINNISSLNNVKLSFRSKVIKTIKFPYKVLILTYKSIKHNGLRYTLNKIIKKILRRK